VVVLDEAMRKYEAQPWFPQYRRKLHNRGLEFHNDFRPSRQCAFVAFCVALARRRRRAQSERHSSELLYGLSGARAW
jgi:hypothetical protein